MDLEIPLPAQERPEILYLDQTDDVLVLVLVLVLLNNDRYRYADSIDLGTMSSGGRLRTLRGWANRNVESCHNASFIHKQQGLGKYLLV